LDTVDMNGTAEFHATDDAVLLEVRNLAKTFGKGPTAIHAVDGIDMSVRRGEVLLVMGPSGAGKTTLLSLIGGLMRPTRGVIRLAGVEVSALREDTLPLVRRRLVGFVFQSFNLLEALSATENVELPMNLAGQKGREPRQKAERLLVELGMEHRLEFRPSVLSGGEKQRVSIARALANDPRLILADEPTANLDSRNGKTVVRLLCDAARQRGQGVIIVSHDDRIREVADRILWLEDGRLREGYDPRSATGADEASGTVRRTAAG
jgi:putative ABC transport system ATP-binding protein